MKLTRRTARSSRTTCTNPNVVFVKVPRTLRIYQPLNVKDVKRYHSRLADLGGSPSSWTGKTCTRSRPCSRNAPRRTSAKCSSNGQVLTCCPPRGSLSKTFRRFVWMSFEACRLQRPTRRRATKPPSDATETCQQTRRSDTGHEGATAAAEGDNDGGATADFVVGEQQQSVTEDFG